MAATHYQHAALRQYQSAGVASAANCANPYQLVEMLLTGAVDRIARARGHMLRSEVLPKIEAIRSAISIVEYLRISIDMQGGGQIARNLCNLYDYMLQRLTKANADNDPVILDEVSALLRDIKSAWDEIPHNVRMRR
jgi:flagellar protein FliS